MVISPTPAFRPSAVSHETYYDAFTNSVKLVVPRHVTQTGAPSETGSAVLSGRSYGLGPSFSKTFRRYLQISACTVGLGSESFKIAPGWKCKSEWPSGIYALNLNFDLIPKSQQTDHGELRFQYTGVRAPHKTCEAGGPQRRIVVTLKPGNRGEPRLGCWLSAVAPVHVSTRRR